MSRYAYLAEHMAVGTLLAAISLQAVALYKGQDPNDMNPMTNPEFWGRALLASGGLAVVGDLVTTGSTSWGGGLPGYLAGPVAQAGSDALALTFGNLTEAGLQFMRGEPIDTNLIPEARRFVDGYLIPEPPFVGPAVDRLILDQFQILLDPESRESLLQAARRNEQRYGNAAWWVPGRPMPGYAP